MIGSDQTNTNYSGHESSQACFETYTIHTQCGGGQEINAQLGWETDKDQTDKTRNSGVRRNHEVDNLDP